MFTGIIEEIGLVRSIKKGSASAVLAIECRKILEELHLGDSVATNGVCLTVTCIYNSFFTADVMNETLSKSSLESLKIGSKVNLERAMPANGRFGGHIVSGHIDGVGRIALIQKDDIAIWYTVKAPQNIMKYIIPKGSITIDGISLTIAKVMQDSFCVSVIPHTVGKTILSEKSIGSVVNLENDILGKYIEKFMQGEKDITKEFLTSNGF